MLKALLRWSFGQLYHTMARSYDAVAALASAGLWYDWVSVTLPFIQGPEVLEVGVGTGHLLPALERHDRFRVIGIDESRQMIQLARRRIDSGPPLLRGKAQALPLQTESIQTIVSTFPSEYIFDPRSLIEFRRVLKAHGRLIIVPAARIQGTKLLQKIAVLALSIAGSSSVGLEQALSDRFVPLLSRSGFRAELHPIPLRSSTAFVILATTAPDPG